jgi:PEP-CTERM motif
MHSNTCSTSFLVLVLSCSIFFIGSSARAVLVADNGFGTANMPVAADYVSQTPLQIIDGLPAATTIDIAGILKAPTASAEVAGGSLSGSISGGDSIFEWTMTGTGSLAGFNRFFNFPIDASVGSVPATSTMGFEVHAAPRTPLAPIQYFDTDMFRMFGQITGDPDFDLLRFVAGSDFGLPGPGETSFTQSGANWDAGSFFDLTYRIDFVGRPGGALSGRSGSTTGTVRISLGTVVPEPSSVLLLGGAVLAGLAHCRTRR